MTIKEAILVLNTNVIVACERAGFDYATVKMVEDALNVVENALQEHEPPGVVVMPQLRWQKRTVTANE
jgi:hypothetical protein